MIPGIRHRAPLEVYYNNNNNYYYYYDRPDNMETKDREGGQYKEAILSKFLEVVQQNIRNDRKIMPTFDIGACVSYF